MPTSVTGLRAACFTAIAAARRVRPSRGVRSPTKSRFNICWPFMTYLRVGVSTQPTCERSHPREGAGRRLREARGLESGEDHARRGGLVQGVKVDAGRA